MTNALQAISGRGQVRIAATVGRRPHEGGARADDVALSINDDGCGMDEATRARIFEPFFTTKPGGRGLGLAAVHAMVQAHGGALAVDSALGRGTSVRLWLPVAAREAAPLTVAPPAPERLSLDGILLVVDDDALVRSSVERIVAKLGIATQSVESGEAALALLADPQAGIRVALIDLSMPGMRGDALARRIAQLLPALPVVLMSGDATDPAIAELPVAACLQKPFKVAELSAVLAPILASLRR
jgi:CheY-like chemotaxis protein